MQAYSDFDIALRYFNSYPNQPVVFQKPYKHKMLHQGKNNQKNKHIMGDNWLDGNHEKKDLGFWWITD